MQIRQMHSSDLSSCNELRQFVSWNQLPEDWSLLLRFSPAGCFVAESNGRVVGSVTTIQYEKKIAWIGMLIVHPENRGRGIGSQLLTRAIEFLRAEKIASIKLDATPQGEPLYAKMGFRKEFEITRWYRAEVSPSNHKYREVRPAKPGDLPKIAELDQESFGVNRGGLLEEIQRRAYRSFVARADENVCAFAMLRNGVNASYLGPFTSPNEMITRNLVNTISDGVSPLIWDVPDLRNHSRLARDLGFTSQRTLARMTLGESLAPQRPERYWGLVDPALG